MKSLPYFLMNRYKLFLTLVIPVTLALQSCLENDPLSRSFDSQTCHTGIADLVTMKAITSHDSLIMEKYLDWVIRSGKPAFFNTYGSLLHEAQRAYADVPRDILLLKSLFEKEKEIVDLGRYLSREPTWYMDDTLKFYYVNLLINGIEKNSEALPIISQSLKNVTGCSSELIRDLVMARVSYNDRLSIFDDDVADKKIMYFAFSYDKKMNQAISQTEMQRYRDNGWKFIEIP